MSDQLRGGIYPLPVLHKMIIKKAPKLSFQHRYAVLRQKIHWHQSNETSSRERIEEKVMSNSAEWKAMEIVSKR